MSVFLLSHVPLEIGFCLLEGCLIRTGIDRKKKVSLSHILTLYEGPTR